MTSRKSCAWGSRLTIGAARAGGNGGAVYVHVDDELDVSPSVSVIDALTDRLHV
jgi:hypothetical protein